MLWFLSTNTGLHLPLTCTPRQDICDKLNLHNHRLDSPAALCSSVELFKNYKHLWGDKVSVWKLRIRWNITNKSYHTHFHVVNFLTKRSQTVIYNSISTHTWGAGFADQSLAPPTSLLLHMVKIQGSKSYLRVMRKGASLIRSETPVHKDEDWGPLSILHHALPSSSANVFQLHLFVHHESVWRFSKCSLLIL